MDSHKAVVKRFANALNAGLTKKFGHIPSTSEIADCFNQQAIGIKGISRETARRWLRGLSYPETDRLQLLIDWLELNPADILLNNSALESSLDDFPEDDNAKGNKKVLFAQQALDALSAQIAILDSNGNIIQVNQSWRKFAAANSSPDDPEIKFFSNYLQVCDQVRGPDKDNASMMAAGIRAVLSEAVTEFAMKYACHSPTEKRWFVARATGFLLKKNKYVVVSHEHISEKNWQHLQFPALPDNTPK
jgi:PAS domain-containing protein